jgi:hypothetical protein
MKITAIDTFTLRVQTVKPIALDLPETAGTAGVRSCNPTSGCRRWLLAAGEAAGNV